MTKAVTEGTSCAPVDSEKHPAPPTGEEFDIRAFDRAVAALDAGRKAMRGVVLGQEKAVDLLLTGILAGGHVLLWGVPGLAKTLLANSLARMIGLDFGRVQFTPDLMPADVTGAEMLDQTAEGKRYFRFIKGPVFCQLLLADEINRASPRAQSALLQAMQEKFVTVGGKRYDLPQPFHVVATQNPLEHEGTYPLPEAQLDRFLLRIAMDYPAEKDERDMVLNQTSTKAPEIDPLFTPQAVIAMQRLVRAMPLGDALLDDIITLSRSLRPHQGHDVRFVRFGPGPRASIAFSLCTRAHALLHGRSTPDHSDIAAVAPAVLEHRIGLDYEAHNHGVSASSLIKDALRA